MLVMTHRSGDKVFIGENIEVEVLWVRGGKVQLGFNAPRDVSIVRDKVRERDRGDTDVQND